MRDWCQNCYTEHSTFLKASFWISKVCLMHLWTPFEDLLCIYMLCVIIIALSGLHVKISLPCRTQCSVYTSTSSAHNTACLSQADWRGAMISLLTCHSMPFLPLTTKPSIVRIKIETQAPLTKLNTSGRHEQRPNIERLMATLKTCKEQSRYFQIIP